ncbi:MAG: hypothetical protein WC827_02925 [Candidatus Paceibacterota bacterium]
MALQLANEETDTNIKKSVDRFDKNKGVVMNYGQLLVVRTMLSEILTKCDVEIELSSGDEAVLVPFIQRHLTSG